MQRQKTKTIITMIYSSITPQTLIEETHNYYGLKAELAMAIDYISHNVSVTPGSFYEWIMTKTKDRLF